MHIEDLRSFERRHGRIPHEAAVLMYSGWGAKVGDPDAYRGTDATGTLHFPGFGPDACEWLLRRRGIRTWVSTRSASTRGPRCSRRT